MILVNQELKKVLFRIQRVGRGTREELVCIMENGKEYDFTMNKKKAEEAISIYHAKYPVLKMSASLKGKLMVCLLYTSRKLPAVQLPVRGESL